MKKPSERIKELARFTFGEGETKGEGYDYPQGIMKYLDEEYSKNQHIETCTPENPCPVCSGNTLEDNK